MRMRFFLILFIVFASILFMLVAFGIELVMAAENFLDRGKKFYESADFPESIKVLEEGIRTMLKSPQSKERDGILSEAYVYLGLSYLATRNIDKTAEYFRESLRYNPQRKDITDEFFPPHAVELFAKIKSTMGGKLIVSSVPTGAELYINDEKRGITPANFEGLSQGVYRVKLTKKYYLNFNREVKLEGGKTEEVKATLNPEKSSTKDDLKLSWELSKINTKAGFSATQMNFYKDKAVKVFGMPEGKFEELKSRGMDVGNILVLSIVSKLTAKNHDDIMNIKKEGWRSTSDALGLSLKEILDKIDEIHEAKGEK